MMTALAAPYINADRDRRDGAAAEGNALQQLASSYRMAADRSPTPDFSEPTRGAIPAAASSGRPDPASFARSPTTPAFASPALSPMQPAGSFTPVNPEVVLTRSASLNSADQDRPGMFTPTDVSMSLPSASRADPASSMSPSALSPAAASPSVDAMRQRRQEESRVKSQMNVLPGMPSAGRFGR